MLDELRCIYCGMCEEACPVDAIELTHIYDMTGETREEMVFDKEKLLGDLRRDEGQPEGPGANAAAGGWVRRRSSRTCRRLARRRRSSGRPGGKARAPGVIGAAAGSERDSADPTPRGACIG